MEFNLVCNHIHQVLTILRNANFKPRDQTKIREDYLKKMLLWGYRFTVSCSRSQVRCFPRSVVLWHKNKKVDNWLNTIPRFLLVHTATRDR